jgi:hypothetical protein
MRGMHLETPASRTAEALFTRHLKPLLRDD